jgi:hypothetical protein
LCVCFFLSQSDLNCTWTIEAGLGLRNAGYGVQIKIVAFDLENHNNCDYDSVTIYDGGMLIYFPPGLSVRRQGNWDKTLN